MYGMLVFFKCTLGERIDVEIKAPRAPSLLGLRGIGGIWPTSLMAGAVESSAGLFPPRHVAMAWKEGSGPVCRSYGVRWSLTLLGRWQCPASLWENFPPVAVQEGHEVWGSTGSSWGPGPAPGCGAQTGGF